MKKNFNTIKQTSILISTLVLAGCNTTETTDSIIIYEPVQRSLNGVWADSSCEYNYDSGYYETIDYDINGIEAAIFIASFNDRNCINLVFLETYEGQVSQTGTVILGNGLLANRLSFSGYDRVNDTALTHTAYFYADSYYLYEYPNPNDNVAFEYERVF